MAGLGGGIVGSEQQLQQQQYLKMRGAQIAEHNAGQKTELGAQKRPEGSRKQIIGTVLGVIAVFAVLILLSLLHII